MTPPPDPGGPAALPRIVIVGGGISGLAAAHHLKRLSRESGRPVEIVLLEASPRTGGNIRSERLEGFLCEWGPNGFLDNAPGTLALIEALGLQERVQPSDDAARRRFIYRNGRLRRVPEGLAAFAGSDLLSWAGKLRVAAEPLVPARRDGKDESIHAFAARRIGREAADVLIASMVRGIFAGDARALSLPACFPRMRQMEDEHGGLVKAMLALRKRKKSGEGVGDLAPVPGRSGRDAAPTSAPGMPSGRLTSLREGMEELTRALTSALGPIVRTSARVSGISPLAAPATGGADRARPARTYRIDMEGGAVLEADAVLVGAPARDAARIVSSLDPELGALVGRIAAAPLSVVCLGFDSADLGPRAVPVNGFGFLVPPGEGPRILGALWDSSIYPGRAPRGKVLMRAMIGGGEDPGAIELSDADMLAVVRADLARTMRVEVAPAFTRIFRHRLGIPQYTLGHLATLDAIAGRLERHPGLLLAGNSYKGVSLNACIAEAGIVARALLQAVA